ncbi:MAG TPA: CRISPR-associated endonuclease Cas2 [Gemmataceae bacterium]|nr:CRISPR-associated endonuclease Cas2 [Gemmataceae bacterium]
MQVLVAYDVSTTTPEGERRLRRVAQACVNFGQRVQKSVFECSVSEMQYEVLKRELLALIDLHVDSLRLYRLAMPKEQFCECFGMQRQVDFEGPLVI